MQLDKENMKKIRWLIAFAVLLYLGVQNLDIIINTAQVLLGFLFPFIVGFGIAFILNVPMKFIEHHLFGKALKQEKKSARKLARPVSLILAICFVICIFRHGLCEHFCDILIRPNHQPLSCCLC